jgi:hypothetical protein
MDSMGPNTWKQRLNNLFIQHPDVRPLAMGFPPDWHGRPVWKNIETQI